MQPCASNLLRRTLASAVWLLIVTFATAQEPKAKSDEVGQKVFVTGHSFHAWIGGPLDELAKAAGLKEHKHVGQQMLGGSRVIQHWDLADEKNTAKKAIRDGKVEVLTMSPHLKLPDEGIDKFTELLLEHNAKGRVYVQASWYPYDMAGKNNQNFKNAERDNAKIADLRENYKPFHKAMSEQVAGLNKSLAEKQKRQVVFLVPVGHAVMALREKVADGKVPGVKQSDLFIDSIGHPSPPIVALAAYCYYAAIYHSDPAGLPVPSVLANAKNPNWDAKFNALLQEIAWEAVTNDPLSGVKKKGK